MPSSVCPERASASSLADTSSHHFQDSQLADKETSHGLAATIASLLDEQYTFRWSKDLKSYFLKQLSPYPDEEQYESTLCILQRHHSTLEKLLRCVEEIQNVYGWSEKPSITTSSSEERQMEDDHSVSLLSFNVSLVLPGREPLRVFPSTSIQHFLRNWWPPIFPTFFLLKGVAERLAIIFYPGFMSTPSRGTTHSAEGADQLMNLLI